MYATEAKHDAAFARGQQDFWSTGVLVPFPGLHDCPDYDELPLELLASFALWQSYEDGFMSAWEDHDNEILREEKPWLFGPGFGAVSREIVRVVVTRDCIIFSDDSPLFN